MTMSQYWSGDEQAWIMPVLLQLGDEGTAYQDWAQLRGEIESRLADQGAGARADDLLRPLDEAVSSGADFTALTAELVTEYQATLGAGADQQEPDATAASRLSAPEPVEGYSGWWQAYDHDEQVWKYVASAQQPGADTTGWIPADQMDWAAADGGSSPQAAADGGSAQFASIDRVEGYAGWWQGYDSNEQVWKYVESADTPGDHTTGWIPADQMDWAAIGERAAQAADTAAASADPEIVAAVDDAIDAALAELPDFGGDELEGEELDELKDELRKIMMGEVAE